MSNAVIQETSIMHPKTIKDITDWQNKRVLVRVDFNVPLADDHQTITDDSRIRESLPTLQYLLERGARVILASHFGRPKGKKNPEFSLAPVAKQLQALLPKTPVTLANDVVSPAVESAVSALKPGEVLLLENTRFEPGEEANDAEFSKKLAGLCDIYVNDAFGAAHRAHASTEGVTQFASVKVAGLLMAREIKALSSVVQNPEPPFVAIIGGSKISTKIVVLEELLNKVNTIIIGGGMIFTFLKAQGIAIGNSLFEDDYVGTAKSLLEKARQHSVTVCLPTDLVIADAFKADAQAKTVPTHAIPDGWMGLDVGPESIQTIQTILKTSKTVLWNGPLGVFEFPAFAAGTKAVATTLAELTQAGQCQSVLGGGDTVAAIEQFQIDKDRYTHVSTGGGASLEFIEGKILPGIAALDKA